MKFEVVLRVNALVISELLARSPPKPATDLTETSYLESIFRPVRVTLFPTVGTVSPILVLSSR